MDFLIYTIARSMEGLPLAMKLQDEGYEVAMVVMDECEADPKHSKPGAKISEAEFHRRKLYPLVGSGLVQKLEADKVEPAPETLIIFDFNYGSVYAEELIKKKCKGIFAYDWAYQLELDRAASADFVRKHYPEIKLPEEHDFPPGSIKEILKFIADSPDFWAIKPNTDELHVFVPSMTDRKSYLAAVLQYLQGDRDAIEKVEVQLQRKINGYECVVETWYRNGEPVLSNVDIELKNMFAGDLLPQTGCSADLVFTIPISCELRRLTNAPFDAIAKKLCFTGLQDADIIFEEQTATPYFLEFCPGRFGYNSLFTLLDRYKGKVGEFFKWIIAGAPEPEVDRSLYGASVRVFDYNHYYYLPEGKPRMMSIPDNYGIWLWDVMQSHKEGRKGGGVGGKGEGPIRVSNHTSAGHIDSSLPDSSQSSTPTQRAGEQSKSNAEESGRSIRGQVDTSASSALYVVGANINTLVVTASAPTPQASLWTVKDLAKRVRFDTAYFRWDTDSRDGNYSILNRLDYLRGSGLLGGKQRRVGIEHSIIGMKELVEVRHG